MPPSMADSGSTAVFLEYFFVLEKYINCRIIPKQYRVLSSSRMSKYFHQNTIGKRLVQFVSLLEAGSPGLNDPSFGFLPRSSNRYFSGHYQTTKGRYSIDYIGDIFRIRHLHILSPSDNCLLFFCIVNDTVYLLNVGDHWSFFSTENVALVHREFPDILPSLGILELPGIYPGKDTTTSEELKETWKAGGNMTLVLDGKVYMGSLMTTARINGRLVEYLQAFLYSVQDGVAKVLRTNDPRNLVLNKVRSRLSLRYGSVFLTNTKTRQDIGIPLSYVSRLGLAETLAQLA